MFTRPRCRKFEPLVTTQIRLRNLIKITGLNFHCDDKKFTVYFTLHLSAFSKPFYTSEKLECRSKVEWPEINCQQTSTSSHKFICVRVWRRDKKKKNEVDLCNDEMLFLWGVYFSGLVSLSGRDHIKFKDNTLLFHLFGETFTSPDQICDTIPESCDQNSDKYSSSPHFSSSYNGSNGASPPTSIDSLHENGGSVTVMEVINESKHLKVRYAQLEFPKNEVRASYSIEKLLLIQEKQRRLKSRLESSQMLADRICMKSAACLNLELIMSKPVFYEPQKQPGMGRTLSLLLSQQKAPPKPEVILKVHELRVKIEGAQFKLKMLTQARDRSRHYNRSLEMKREKLKDENTEKETRIWNSLRALSRENLKTGQEKLTLQKEVLVNVRLALGETKQCLLRELNEIYTVKKNDRGQFTINEIHLPDAEMYSETTSSSTEVSIALGYVAHAVLIIARILDFPLRNAIKYEGSRSRIFDNVKVLPPSDRMFPLFCRASPPPNVLLYGVYLLNQNISQLKHILGLNRGDLRSTLANLWDLMNCVVSEISTKQFNEDSGSVRRVDNYSTSSVDSVPLISINIPTTLSPTSARVSRSLDDFDDLLNFKAKLNSSAPDLTSPDT